MALFLTERDVERLLTMDVALEVVEGAAREIPSGGAINQPRSRLAAGGKSFQMMVGAVPSWGVLGYKCYIARRGGAYFLVYIYSLDSGELLAVIEGNKLGQMRTGAASGVATKHMARPDAQVVGVIGSGWQARSQLEAVCAVRHVERVRVFSRSEEKRTAFAEEMGPRLAVAIEGVDNPEVAVDGSDIMIVATNTNEPVLMGKWLSPGIHVNAIGANSTPRRELDDEAVLRCGTIVVESKEQAHQEAADLLGPIEGGKLTWERVSELGDVVAGNIPGRTDEREITLFKSLGVALWDVATGYRVYQLAREGESAKSCRFKL